MMFKAFKWRLDEDVPAIKYSTDELLDSQNPKLIKQLETGKFFLHGTDNENRPVAYLTVRLHRPGDQPPKTLERLTVYVCISLFSLFIVYRESSRMAPFYPTPS